MKKFVLALLISILGGSIELVAQQVKKVVYKKTPQRELVMECMFPENMKPRRKYPTIVFFFGGGWIQGSPEKFLNQAKALTAKGMVTIRVDYRTKKNAGTTPFESLKDAKSAMRYIKTHAKELHVDLKKLAASGGSAGGHLAAATCYVEGFNEDTDDLSVSTRPTALVLYNPVVDNSEQGYGYDRVKGHYKEFSPIFNIKNPVPTIFLLGSKDRLIPEATAYKYKSICEEQGGRCDVKIYEGCQHGFFNKVKYRETLDDTVKFLESIGYIKK